MHVVVDFVSAAAIAVIEIAGNIAANKRYIAN